jgi:glycosyltransferase involved in cell wall biosynthesis
MDYPPNVDAVLWFTNHVMPLLPKDILFVIIGSNPNKQILELARKLPERIIVTGFILSPAAIFQGAICSVAPMQTGSGIQNKILESMAAGNVVITSSLAAKPLAGAIDGIHFLVSDSPNDFSAKIIGLLENRYDVGNMKNAAKELMMKQYSWDKHYAAWQKLVDEILYEN